MCELKTEAQTKIDRLIAVLEQISEKLDALISRAESVDDETPSDPETGEGA
jgi:hypothetical protein